MAVTGVAAREWQGVQFPAAGTWALDATHTAIEFEAKHQGLQTIGAGIGLTGIPSILANIAGITV